MQTNCRGRKIEKDICFWQDQFEIKVNPRYVLKGIECYPDSPIYEEMLELYNEYYEIAKKVIRPKVAYILENNNNRHGITEIEDCEQVIYACLTLGEGIENLIEEKFESGEALEGMLLEGIGIGVMFNLSEQAYKLIYTYLDEQRKGCIQISPGERGIDISYQKNVIDKVGRHIGVEVTDAMMLKPLKSASIIYGIKEGIDLPKRSHECKKCFDKICKWRLEPYES